MSYLVTQSLSAAASVSASAISITAISVINIGALLWLGSRSAENENRQIALWGHSLWSGMWLDWLIAWLVSGQSKPVAIALEDLGSFLLIGCAVVRLWGLAGLKRYASISYFLFVLLDLLWPLAVYFEWNRADTRYDLFYNTLMYSPSLCLVVFAMGLFGWSQLRLQVSPVIRFTSAFAAGGYALIQVLVYQVYLFGAGNTIPEGNSPLWKALMVTWRSFFVIVYWVELLTWVGVRLPEGPARQLASKLGWLPPVIATVVLERYLGKP